MIPTYLLFYFIPHPHLDGTMLCVQYMDIASKYLFECVPSFFPLLKHCACTVLYCTVQNLTGRLLPSGFIFRANGERE